MIKTLPSGVGGVGSIPGQGARSHKASQLKTTKQKLYVTDSIKTLKWSRLKKKILKNLQTFIKKISGKRFFKFKAMKLPKSQRLYSPLNESFAT